MATLLADTQIVELTGADATAFAQAQFSSDLSTLRDGEWQWSAWLSAQGRVRAFFHLLHLEDDRLLLWLRGGSAGALRDALAGFVFRAKVRIAVVENMRALVGPLSSGHTLAANEIAKGPSESIRIALPGDPPRMGELIRAEASSTEVQMSATARNAAALADIDAGLPTLAPELDDLLLPDWFGLPLLGAVSVGKGCYPGQEIVARLHFKGGNKRWLHRLWFDAPSLPKPGDRIGLAAQHDDAIVISAAWSGEAQGRALAAIGDNDARTLPVSSSGIVIRKVEHFTKRAERR